MNNKKQQTAVEQFAIALYEGGYLQGNGDEIEKLLNTFQAMHKEEIENAYTSGVISEMNNPLDAMHYKIDGEQYYELTYGGNK
jgi:hypothetical protein